MRVASWGGDLRTWGGLVATGVLEDMMGWSGILWRNVNLERLSIGDRTYVIEHVVGLPAPHGSR